MTAWRHRFGRAWRGPAIAAALAVTVLALVGLRSEIAGAGAAGLRRGHDVVIDHFAYHPPTLTVAVGSRVVFTNTSGTAHTATDPGAFDTGHIRPGHSFSVRFGHRGTFLYHCTIHPFMHGKIVVK